MLRKSLDRAPGPAVSVCSASRQLCDPEPGAGPLWAAIIIIASSSDMPRTLHGQTLGSRPSKN